MLAFIFIYFIYWFMHTLRFDGLKLSVMFYKASFFFFYRSLLNKRINQQNCRTTITKVMKMETRSDMTSRNNHLSFTCMIIMPELESTFSI
jgi:hypothetical protein